MIPIWTMRGGGPTATNPGLTEHLAIIDVDGTPVIVTQFIQDFTTLLAWLRSVAGGAWRIERLAP